ncbi:DUF7282 domain-containing protein [Halorussus lipolyticus]|uniref:DUF7282 domain-containing protein n=1 Tax=Halorussus lipolyticus TaxID=3034024 RepID=UPI0023E84391|nr:hypothetical protein [Halorussus sp. DT80]
MTRNATLGAIVFAVLLVTTGLSGAVGPSPAGSSGSASPAPLAQETTTQGNETANESASVTFNDQSLEDSSVVVSEANLSEGGYVVVFAQNGTALGNSSYLEPGSYENLTVNLTTSLSRSQVLIATPHLDTNDNRTFDFNATQAMEAGRENATDRPYLQATGLPVNSVAFVTVGDSAGRNETTTASRVAPTA